MASDSVPQAESSISPDQNPGWKRRLAPFAGFFGVQVIVQGLMFVTGVLVVRTMSKSEYALYNVANTMQGAIAILADSGTSSALTAIGGVVWQDKQRLGELIQTALGFRRRFGVAAGCVVGPILFWLLYSQGASLLYALLLTLTVLTASSFALTHGVLVTVPRLHTRIRQLQQAELLLAGLRLLLIGAACWLGLNALVGLAIFVATLAIQNTLYRRWAARDADMLAPQNHEDRAAIWKLVRQQAPSSIYYCAQGSLTVALLAALGQSGQVADAGALGRIAVLLTVVSSVVSNLVIPRFARCHDYSQLLSMYRRVVAVFVAICGAFLGLGIFFPSAMLFILGEKYAGLGADLPYMLFASSVASLAGILYSLNAARGWLQGGWLTIPITIAIQVALIPFLDLGTLRGAVLLTSLPVLPAVTPYVYRAYREFGKMAAATNAV